jgi:hypothetical protein
MIKKISNWVDRISSNWLMITSLLLMGVFIGFVLPAQAASSTQKIGSDQSPDTSLFYTPEDLYQIAEEYGAEGRQAYIRIRWSFDLIFPLVYTTFLAVGISWFNQRVSGWGDAWKLLNLAPILGGMLDLLENSATSLVMAIYPARSAILLISASLITPIKWVLVSGSFIPYFILVSAWLIQRIQGRN